MMKTTTINPFTPASKAAGQKIGNRPSIKKPTGSINSVNDK